MADQSTNLRYDPRFAAHQRQPRANKLDFRQRAICRVDHAYAEALRRRVSHEGRFSAFIAGASYYIELESPCPKCDGLKRRTRDRSCYRCHLKRGEENFERMRAGAAPVVGRSLDGHLDLLERAKAERRGEHIVRQFGQLTAKRWPTGRLEIIFPSGAHELDLGKLEPHVMQHALDNVPELKAALVWAGWF